METLHQLGKNDCLAIPGLSSRIHASLWLIATVALALTAPPAHSRPLRSIADSLWRRLAVTPSDSSAISMSLLLRISDCYRQMDDQALIDSAEVTLMERLRLCPDETVKMEALSEWFTRKTDYEMMPKPFADTIQVAGYVQYMRGVARRRQSERYYSQSWIAEAIMDISEEALPSALDAAGKGYYYASLCNAETEKVTGLLLMAYVEQKRSNRLDAFRHYLDALHLATEADDPQQMEKVCNWLAIFYRDLANYDKSEQYLFKSLELLKSQKKIDSTALILVYENLALLDLKRHNYASGVKAAREILNYWARSQNGVFRTELLTILTSLLIENGRLKSLADLYRVDYPDELTSLSSDDPPFYYQLRAAFAEADAQPDSAMHFYALAEARVRASRRPPASRAFFYRRYSQALLRFGKTALALPWLDTALRYNQQIQWLPYMAELSTQLDTVSASLGNISEAYRYSRLSIKYNAALAAANRQDEILMLDLENEARTRELQARQEEAQTERRHNLQYMAITLLIGVCFLVLTLLGLFRVPLWAISAMGFFSFIFFFEFIILLIDTKVHHMTHGEPWKIMSIKIVIIAGLLPLHHWMEHKVVHFLHHHHILDTSRFAFFRWRRGKPPASAAPPAQKATEAPTPGRGITTKM